MDLDKVLNLRRSVRHYLKKPVPRELLVKLAEAALLAPTACNLQLTRYVFVDDFKILERLSREVSYKFSIAPACIVVVYDPRFTAERNSVVSSAAMGAQNILLKAVDLGLGACAMAGFSKDEIIKKVLNISPELEILLIIPVGFPAPEAKAFLPFKIPPQEAFCFNVSGFKKDLNDSRKLSKYSLPDVIKYRSRISTVYLSSFGLNTFPRHFYEKALEFWKTFILSKNVKSLIDVLSYDGMFLKCLFSDEIAKKLDITSSDYLKRNLDFFKETFNCGTCLISDQNKFTEQTRYDAATLVFQADFTPRFPDLIYSLKEIIKPGGYVFVALLGDSLWRRLAKTILSYVRILRGQKVNVYEGSSFYKIGPRQYMPERVLINIFKNNRFCAVEMAFHEVEKGVTLKFFVFKKED